MADIEKVIKGLEHCISEGDCRGCPYFKDILDSRIICPCREDALALLKEQDKIIQNVLREKTNELNNKVTTLRIESQNREMRRLLEQK